MIKWQPYQCFMFVTCWRSFMNKENPTMKFTRKGLKWESVKGLCKYLAVNILKETRHFSPVLFPLSKCCFVSKVRSEIDVLVCREFFLSALVFCFVYIIFIALSLFVLVFVPLSPRAPMSLCWCSLQAILCIPNSILVLNLYIKMENVDLLEYGVDNK